eukprot:4809004-Amphidinium_carterae.2
MTAFSPHLNEGWTHSYASTISSGFGLFGLHNLIIIVLVIILHRICTSQVWQDQSSYVSVPLRATTHQLAPLRAELISSSIKLYWVLGEDGVKIVEDDLRESTLKEPWLESGSHLGFHKAYLPLFGVIGLSSMEQPFVSTTHK